MKPGWNYFVREVDPWRIFHLLEMFYCTMQRGQFTKQAFGLPVNKFNRIVPVQRPGVGSGIRIPSPGHQFGLPHQLLVKHVLNYIFAFLKFAIDLQCTAKILFFVQTEFLVKSS